MTEFMDAPRLRQLAVNQPVADCRRPVPVLCWTVDRATLRPVCHWVLQDNPEPPDLSA